MTTALEKYVKTIFTSNIKGIVIDDKHCMKYTNKSCVKPEEIAFTIHLPFGLLKSWHENKKPVLENYSYVQILNAFIGERYPTKINENCLRICLSLSRHFEYFSDYPLVIERLNVLNFWP